MRGQYQSQSKPINTVGTVAKIGDSEFFFTTVVINGRREGCYVHRLAGRAIEPIGNGFFFDLKKKRLFARPELEKVIPMRIVEAPPGHRAKYQAIAWAPAADFERVSRIVQSQVRLVYIDKRGQQQVYQRAIDFGEMRELFPTHFDYQVRMKIGVKTSAWFQWFNNYLWVDFAYDPRPGTNEFDMPEDMRPPIVEEAWLPPKSEDKPAEPTVEETAVA
ncbi:MAG: hypothetical protein ABIE68_04625 [bacterium]